MALTPQDKAILQRCLNREAGGWNDFVDRYLGLIYHVVHHTAHLRSVTLQPEDVEDVAADIMLQLVNNNYAVLRQFRGRSSLATYVTVVARRACLHELNRRFGDKAAAAQPAADEVPRVQMGLDRLEEVQQLMGKLPSKEREVVRLFYLEGRSYEEISSRLQIPVNSIGPVLNRARQRLRGDGKPAAEQPPKKSPQQQQPKN